MHKRVWPFPHHSKLTSPTHWFTTWSALTLALRTPHSPASKLTTRYACWISGLIIKLTLVLSCQLVACVTSRQHLRSATRQLLVVPRHRLSSYGWRAFCVAGPSVWNSLPDSLRDPVIGGNSFRQSLKTFMFATYWCIQHSRGFTMTCYINRLFTSFYSH